jgi:hypothetical protein
LESETNRKYMVQMEDYGEIIEKIDLKPIIHKEIYDLLSKGFSSVDSLKEILHFLHFLKFHPMDSFESTFVKYSTSKNVDELSLKRY